MLIGGIREATVEDSPALAGLSSQLGYPTTSEQCRDRIRMILGSGEHAVFVACCGDGTVIGFIHVFLAQRVESDAFAELGGLVVAEEHRGRGVGTRLLQAAQAWAVRRRAPILRVRSRSNRIESHVFYERLGFSRTKGQLVLDKNLGESGNDL